MILCKDCKHWRRIFYASHPTGRPAPHRTGKCSSTYFVYNTDIPRNGLGYDSTDSPSLCTGEEFGCVHGCTRKRRGMTSLPICICCGRTLETRNGVIYDGVPCEARRSIGSQVFDALAFGGEPYAVFALCDECLVKMRRLGRVEVVARAEMANASSAPAGGATRGKQ